MPDLILVTGGGGFIGSHTVDALLARGYAVRVYDSLEPQVHGPLGEWSEWPLQTRPGNRRHWAWQMWYNILVGGHARSWHAGEKSRGGAANVALAAAWQVLFVRSEAKVPRLWA